MNYQKNPLDVRKVKFQNRTLPNADFELIRLERLVSRESKEELGTLHRVEFYLLLLVTEGNGFHRIDFTDYPYESGSIISIRKDQIQFFSIENLSGYLLLFLEEFIVSYLEKQEALKAIQLFNELLGTPKIKLDKEDFQEILQLVQDMEREYFQMRDKYSLGIIRSQLHILITKLYRAKYKQEAKLQTKKYLADFIKFQELVEKYCFSTKKVQDYAERMGVTTKTLNNIVRGIINKSAKTFIDEIVILQIKRLLVNSSLSIKEIAYTAGFEEPANLYKYFKKYTHSSPENFRKSHA